MFFFMSISEVACSATRHGRRIHAKKLNWRDIFVVLMLGPKTLQQGLFIFWMRNIYIYITTIFLPPPPLPDSDTTFCSSFITPSLSSVTLWHVQNHTSQVNFALKQHFLVLWGDGLERVDVWRLPREQRTKVAQLIEKEFCTKGSID